MSIFRFLALSASTLLVATPASSAPMSQALFQELHAQLKPAADEAWRTLPWKLSVLEAQAQATREKKPVYMLVRSGHPLGCV